jgi:exodeoxyribonuclease V gamma subunit
VDTLQITQQFDHDLRLEATFPTLQKNRSGEHLWLQVTPSVIVDNKRKAYRPRPEHTVQLWVEHLLLNSHQATHSCLLGREGMIQFAPITQASAIALLTTLMQWVYRGLQEPLPLEIKTAFEGIKENHKDWQQATLNDSLDALHDKAQEFYDNGGYNQTAQKFVAAYTARYFPDYASLTATETFNTMVQALYHPMLQHVFESLPTAEEVA